MKIVKPDEAKLDREISQSQKAETKQKRKESYLKKLRKDSDFQEYVIKGLFEDAINQTFCLDNIPVTDDLDKVGEFTVQYKLAKEAVLKLIQKLK